MYGGSFGIAGAVVCGFICLITGTGLSAQSLPFFSTGLFAGSGDCAFCHSAATGVLTDPDGNDVSPPATWRGTMMANASRDPYWRAKVSAELKAYPAISGAIEDKCTTCHAPMARTQAHYDGSDAYRLDMLPDDPAGQDGVSCTLCHQIDPLNMGTTDSFSGHYAIDDKRLIYGPYVAPMTAQMQNRVNYTPTHSTHMESSELCATCHTLFTSYVDDDGNLTGRFPEQTPYLEWRNSVYADRGETCQKCHMRAVDEPMVISIRPFSLTTMRRPVWGHSIVGANTLVPGIMRDNPDEIGVVALSEDFNGIAGFARNFLNQALNMTLSAKTDADTLFVDVELKNMAGHKVPTGFPSRRVWIHLVVKDETDTVVFESGAWDSSGNPAGIGNEFQPHYDIISQPGQVQIYEAVMGDSHGAPTETLLAAASYLKDNRLPPEGFDSGGYGYADTAPAGKAAFDADFNVNGEVEGSGADVVHYHIPIASMGGGYTVDAEICYASISMPFIGHLTASGTPESETFLSYHSGADTTPAIIAEGTLHLRHVGILDEDKRPEHLPEPSNYPNPFNRMTTIRVYIPVQSDVSLVIRNSAGQTVKTLADRMFDSGFHSLRWDATDDNGRLVGAGVYLCDLRVGRMSASHSLSYLK